MLRGRADRAVEYWRETNEKTGREPWIIASTSDWMRISCDAVKMGPGESSRSHKKDEFVFVEEIGNGIQTYINFIKKLSTSLEITE